MAMLHTFGDFQKLGKIQVDATLDAVAAASKGVQALAVEVTDFSRKSFEQGTAAAESLLGARSLDRVLEIQADYARASYESFVAQATRIGALYAELARAAYKPFEQAAAQATPARFV
jgi:hypothetical protein